VLNFFQKLQKSVIPKNLDFYFIGGSLSTTMEELLKYAHQEGQFQAVRQTFFKPI
jgi:hypothetical protein